MKRWVTLAGVLGLTLGAAACRLKTEAPPAEVERSAPDFSLAAHDGTTVSLGQLLERGPAILVFYRGHW